MVQSNRRSSVRTQWSSNGLRVGALALVAATQAVAGDAPAVTPAWDPEVWVSRGDSVEIVLDRQPSPALGRVVVQVGQIEVTEVLQSTPRGLAFVVGALPLPVGELQLKVSLVDPSGNWRELASFPLKVRTRAGWEQADLKPSLDLSGKAQVDQGHRPSENAPDRPTYQDYSMQAGVRTIHSRGNFSLRSNVTLVGMSRKQEALRFRERGADAPRVDLASYLVQVDKGKLSLALGHVTVSAQRHLVSGVSSRGATAAYRFSPALSVRAAAVAGSSTVGWSNLSGLGRREHTVLAGTVSLEAVPSRPGAFRLEVTLMDGSVVPSPGFNRGAVVSAEESDGGALRVVASDPVGRFNLDAGYARATYRPGRDPEIEAGLTVTPLLRTTKSARYLDASYALVQGASLGENHFLDVTLGARHEKVEPLYRSVAAFVAADQRLNVVDMIAAAGPASFHVSIQESEDNLDRIPSVLTTDTKRFSANLAFTPAAMLGGGAGWPVVTLVHDRVHQAGRGLPDDPEFEPGHVPDQISRNSMAGLQWQGDGWSVGYEWTSTEQDNRQPGRELSDFETRVDSINGVVAVSGRLDLGLDLSQERAKSLEVGQIDRTRRWGVNANWRLTDRMAVLANAARTWTSDNLDHGRTTGIDVDAQWSLSFSLPPMGLGPARGSLFARYTNRRLDALDRIFGFAEANRQWTVNTGFNLSFFSR